jgi:membrane protein implicated in regulation of membrane protease activity
MSSHLTDEQMVAFLHGTLSDGARAEARGHVASCALCAGALARDAALDEVLWTAADLRRATAASASRIALDPAAPPAASKPRPARSRAARWVLGGGLGAAATALLVQASGGAGSAGLAAHAMAPLFAWQGIIFYIPLALGILLVIGWALGGLHHGADHDADPGHDHDHDQRTGDVARGQAGGLLGRTLELLGVGRVPLMVALMIASLYFGGGGIICNTVLASLGLPPSIYSPISVVVAFVAMLLLAGRSARLLGRVMPTSETYLVSRHSFAGCTGRLLTSTDATSGYAQVKDREGNVHNIKCRTTAGTLPKGEEILVVEYDDETKTFLVDANPVSGHPAT